MMPLNTEEQIANVIRRDANSRQLCFPKLQVLVLGRNPYSDKSFYTVFEESPLKNFIAKGSLKSMMNISQAMLSDLSTFVLDIAPTEASEDGKISYVQEFSANQHKELTESLNRILCSNTAIETAKLTLKDYTFPLSLSGYMEWPDLKELELHANVCLSSIMMIADQSPLLSKLEVTCITIDIHDIDRALNDLKHHGSAQDLRVSSKLEHLRVFYAKENEVNNTFKAIAYITRKLGSLKEVGSPKQVMRRLGHYLPQHLPKPPFLSEVGV
ncbi:hypothetical protein GGI12_004940 [Dipsacomyces acuminosporus]|nr:hypothetical protein GGI12_004940 [Dipsacomyces acuminosporus]